jgi:uncharacterized protein (TIGR02001 family)
VPVPAPRRVRRGCRSVRSSIGIGAIGFALLSLAGNAAGEFSGTITVVSDYRYRGISLSDNDPAAQLGVAYDDARGWYAGAFVSTVKSSTYRTSGVQAITFAGYAWRLASGLSLEAGADYSVVTAEPRYDYPEVYVGFAFQNLSGRVYYSPRYAGLDSRAVYGELNLAQPLPENVRMLAHVGVLSSNAKPPYGYGGPTGSVVDFAIGAGADWQGFNLQLSWVGVNHASPAYQVTGVGHRTGAVFSISHPF